MTTLETLESYLVVDIYSGHFLYPGFMDIFFGYRILDGDKAGQIVFSLSPIRVTIKP
jgi:hypothetical protein